MKIECPCKDCTEETGRSLTCHNIETCGRWAKYITAKREQSNALFHIQKSSNGPKWTEASIKRRANSSKYNTKRNDIFSKGW